MQRRLSAASALLLALVLLPSDGRPLLDGTAGKGEEAPLKVWRRTNVSSQHLSVSLTPLQLLTGERVVRDLTVISEPEPVRRFRLLVGTTKAA